MKHLIASLLLIPAWVPTAGLASEMEDRVRRAVVSIGEGEAAESQVHCTGFFSGDRRHVITARHCAVGRKFLHVETYGQERLAVKGISAGGNREDVVVLVVTEPRNTDVSPLAIARSAPGVGARVTAFGSPIVSLEDVNETTLTHFGSPWVAGRVFSTGAELDSGFSGGPAVNAAGEVIGLFSSSMTAPFNDARPQIRSLFIGLWGDTLSRFQIYAPPRRLGPWNEAFKNTLEGRFQWAGNCVDDPLMNVGRIDVFRKILRENPQYSEVAMQLGACLMIAQDPRRKLAAYLQAARSKPNAETHFWIARTYEELGNRTAARVEYGKIRRLNPAQVDPLILEEIRKI
jgi:hypothetical protein